MPGEVLPLVSAINLHMARFAAQARVQSQFLDDASHQLRTPLSVLRTQTAYALRETDPRRSVQPFWRCRRAWTGPCVPPTRCWPWRAQGRLPGRRWVRARAGRPGRDGERRYPHLLPAARTRQLDVGMDVPPGPVKVLAADWLLREAVSNLVDNAIRSPQGGDLTVRVQVGDGRQGWWWRTAARACRPRTSPAPACVSGGERRAEQARRRPGPGHRRHHCRDPGREAGPGEPAPQAGLRAALVFTLENTVDAAPHHENHRI